MIDSFEIEQRRYALITERLVPNKNVFSILVGKNGTGKSRVLRACVNHFSASSDDDRETALRPRRFAVDIYANGVPSKVIAFSTSPFDRFPINQIPRWHRVPYAYLGLRGLNSRNLSYAYMSRIAAALITSTSFNTTQAKAFDVLRELKFEDAVIAKFSFVTGFVQLKKLVAHGSYQELINHIESFLSVSNHEHNPVLTMPGEHSQRIESIVDALHQVLPKLEKPLFNVDIGQFGLQENQGIQIFHGLSKSIVTLLEAGLLKLRDLRLTRLGDYRGMAQSFSLNEASSGEQSIILSFLGIASQIQDGALVCIDEPEICLHPEWQERYIDMLITCFQSFRDCHFIIATHSPQIIANLQADNCFVTNMESALTTNASELRHKSVDFQLATTFGAPGFSNEYLTRELLGLVIRFSKKGNFTKEQRTIVDKLLGLESDIASDDPNKDLMKTLRAMVEVHNDR